MTDFSQEFAQTKEEIAAEIKAKAETQNAPKTRCLAYGEIRAAIYEGKEFTLENTTKETRLTYRMYQGDLQGVYIVEVLTFSGWQWLGVLRTGARFHQTEGCDLRPERAEYKAFEWFIKRLLTGQPEALPKNLKVWTRG